MSTIDELKHIVDANGFEDAEILKKQLDLLGTLPGEQNKQVFDKLLELANYDPNAINIFINQFIKTSVKLVKK